MASLMITRAPTPAYQHLQNDVSLILHSKVRTDKQTQTHSYSCKKLPRLRTKVKTSISVRMVFGMPLLGIQKGPDKEEEMTSCTINSLPGALSRTEQAGGAEGRKRGGVMVWDRILGF